MNDLRKIVKAAKDQGWAVEPNKNGHLVFRGPSGQLVVGVGDHRRSDHRAVRNMVAMLRRAGLEV